MFRISWLAVLCFLLRANLFAQQTAVPLRYEESFYLETLLADSLSGHTFLKPFFIASPFAGTGKKHLFRAEPVLDLAACPQVNGGSFFYRAGAGARVQWLAGQKWTSEVTASFHAASFPSFLFRPEYERTLVPFYGIPAGTRGKSLLWPVITGYVNYQAAAFLTLRTGVENHFWGEGYRSLFLSDNTRPWPFLSATASVWHIRYIYLLGLLKDTDPFSSSASIHSKYLVLHLLEWNIVPRWSVQLFEGIVWANTDTLQHRAFDWQYANPVLFFRPVEFSIGSPDNVMLGIGSTLQPAKQVKIYSQLLLDEFYKKEVVAGKGWWANKYAWQAGIKLYRPFGISGTSFLAEYNRMRPFTYSYRDILLNYGNMGRPLAHPLGANGDEFLLAAFRRVRKWDLSVRINRQRYGTDSASVNLGGNIYRPNTTRAKDYDNRMFQGQEQVVWQSAFTLAYRPFRRLLIRWEAGILWRMQMNATGHDQTWILFAGIRTPLYNDDGF